jgi:citrate lyase beta subunit
MKSDMPRLRSLLYVPGVSERMILKARESAADAVILDLEDGVAPEQKLDARQLVVRTLQEIDFGEKELYVRINPLATEWGLEDARAVTRAGALGLVIPKAERPDDVTAIAPIVQSGSHIRHGKLICMIETPRGVMASREIAESDEAVVGLMFGSADLARALGCTLSEDEREVLFARSQVLLSARVAGVGAYDSPHFAISDPASLHRMSQSARNLGYDGKAVIHPSHVEIVNEIFTISEKQIADAERIVAAMKAAREDGVGAVSLDGRMIDQVHLSAAEKVLQQANRK